MRTFLAYTLPTEIKHLAVETKNSLLGLNCRDIKWVEDDNLHITLQFLGEIREDQLQELDRIITETMKSAPLPEFKTLGIEAFPANNPRILWLKLDFDEVIAKFHRRVVKQLRELCPKMDVKPFKAHITIGRIKDYLPPVILSRMLAYPVPQNKFTSEEVVLYKSILSKKGAQYIPISEYVIED